jgi:purine-binding chemotaxis protein CheW
LGCNLTDRTIVVEWQGIYVGIVAHDVYDVESLRIEPIDLDLIQGRQLSVDKAFITGIAQLNQHPVICLDLDRLIREPDELVSLKAGDLPALRSAGMDFHSRCCPHLSMAEMEIFARRAAALKVSITESQIDTDEGILVVQIGTEYMGFPLELVVDVDTLDRFPISSVPVSPNYIIGQINWRGSILPILEVGNIFQIQILPRQEFVVVEVDSPEATLRERIKIGIAVDKIFDVSYLANTQVEELPIAMSDRFRTYVRGVTRHEDSMMYLLRLKELIGKEFLMATV